MNARSPGSGATAVFDHRRQPTPSSRQSTGDYDLLKGTGGKFPETHHHQRSVAAVTVTAAVATTSPDPLTPPVTTDDPEEEDVLAGIGNPPIPPVHPDEDEIHHPNRPPSFDHNRRPTGMMSTLISLSEDTLKPYDTQGPSTPVRVQKWQHDVFAVEVKDQQKDETHISLKTNERMAQLQSKRIEKKQYPCDQCGRVFNSRSELRHHARRYEKRPYTCDECDRSFLYPKDLRRHKTTHTGSKQYKCRLCPKSFSRKDNLRRHIHNEHGVTNVPLSPSLVAVDITGTRRNKEPSEDSEQGFDNRPLQHSFSMPRTDVAEPSGGNSQSAADAGGGAVDGGERSNHAPGVVEMQNIPEAENGHSAAYDPRKSGGSNQPTIGDITNDIPELDEPEEESVPDVGVDTGNAASDGQFLICPWRRWKPLVYRKCNGKFKDHAKVIHHLKQSHKIFFHATCVQRFLTRSELEFHLDQEACCRSCRKHFGSREIKDKHIKDTHDSRPGQDRKPEQRELWQLIYEQCCGDFIKHNPYWGKDNDEAEEQAISLYPIEFYKPLPPGSHHTDHSIETEGLGSETTTPQAQAATVSSGRSPRQGRTKSGTKLKSLRPAGQVTGPTQADVKIAAASIPMSPTLMAHRPPSSSVMTDPNVIAEKRWPADDDGWQLQDHGQSKSPRHR